MAPPTEPAHGPTSPPSRPPGPIAWLLASLCLLATPAARAADLLPQAEQARQTAMMGDLAPFPSLLQHPGAPSRSFWPTFFAMATLHEHRPSGGPAAIAFHNPFVGAAWVVAGNPGAPLSQWQTGHLWMGGAELGGALRGPLHGLAQLSERNQQTFSQAYWWFPDPGADPPPAQKLHLLQLRQAHLLTGFAERLVVSNLTPNEEVPHILWVDKALAQLDSAIATGALPNAPAELQADWRSLPSALRKTFRPTALFSASDREGLLLCAFNQPGWWLLAAEPDPGAPIPWTGRLPSATRPRSLDEELETLASDSLAKLDQRFDQLRRSLRPALDDALAQLQSEKLANDSALRAADQALRASVALLVAGAAITFHNLATTPEPTPDPASKPRRDLDQIAKERRAFRMEMETHRRIEGVRETEQVNRDYNRLRWIGP